MNIDTLIEENKLLKQELFDYKNLFESVEVAIIVIDECGTYLDYNKAYYNLMGYTDKDVLKEYHPADVSPKFQPDGTESFSKANEMIKIALDIGSHSFEWLHTKIDGTDFLSHISLDIIEFNNKKCIRAVISDLSEIKKLEQEVNLRTINLKSAKEHAEQLLQEQKDLLSLFDKSDSVLFKWNNDEEWSIAHVSDNISKLLEYTKEDFLSKKVSYASCIHQDDLEYVSNEVSNAVTQNLDFFKHDPYRIITKSGQIKWILDYTVIQKDKEGTQTHFIGYIADITELKNTHKKLEEAKQKAEESDKSKSMFLANMSHEIRTPLNAILGFVSLLKNENKGRDKSLEYINVVESSSKTLLNTIEDILDFSKIESGKLAIDLIDFNLKDELGVITNLFDAKCSEKDITLSLTFEDNLPQAIKSDPHRIKQVISNLLSNAVKFTQAHKNIEIKIGVQNNNLRVSVRDEGKGIAEDKLALIFEPFSQEDNSTTREFGGTGLGLSISNELVRLLGGGKLKVKSELDVGSEFSFDIPIQVVDSFISSKEDIENVSFIGKKLLVVEDNKSNQLFMSILLEELEIDCDIANDGIEAIDIFQLNKYNAILMDENMPNMSGIEATKHIVEYEKQNALTHTPIIALTANALKGDREKFLNAGMDEYMTKPLEKSTLIKILSMFLK